jgi:hypothetical protein
MKYNKCMIRIMVLGWLLCLVAIVGLAVLSAAAGTQDKVAASMNLAPNPSAEQIDKKGRPVGWGHYDNTPDEWGLSSVQEGATFFVDDVYIGTQEPPQSVASTPHRRIRLPEKIPLIKGEGYKPHKPGTVRLWDANKRYTMKHYDMRAWQDRAVWSQVPYSTTDYQFRGDCILEGDNFWVSLHSSRYDSVFLYAKTDTDATPGRHNELYRAFDKNSCYIY